MDGFFNFLQTYRNGVLLLLFCLACITFLVQWVAWIFGVGRFKKSRVSVGTGTRAGTGSGAETSAAKAFSIVLADAIFKIINEFRHLLALLIVVIFAFALAYSLIKAAGLPTGTGVPSTIDNMKEALQAVVATLGGLVGSIIGYYFGESSTARGTPDTGSTEKQKPPPAGTSTEGATKAPGPPAKAKISADTDATAGETSSTGNQ